MSQEVDHERRTVLKIFGAATIITATGVPASAKTQRAVDSDTSRSRNEPNSVLVTHLETGETSEYTSFEEIDFRALEDGEYELIERTADGRRPVQRRSIRSRNEVATTENSEVDLSLSLGDWRNRRGVGPGSPHFADGDTVSIGARGTREEGGVPVGVSDLELTVEIVHEDGKVIDSYETKTDSDGIALVEHEIEADDPEGEYEARLAQAETPGQQTRFRVGEFIKPIIGDGTLTPGRETTLAFYAGDGGEPTSTSTDVSITGPDGSQEIKSLETDSDGIGLLAYTPEQEGEYEIELENHSFSVSCRQLKATVETTSTQRIGEPVTISGYVLDGVEPAGAVDIEAVIERHNDTKTTIPATTNQYGQFFIEWDAPEERASYTLALETSDGRPLLSNDVSIQVREFTDESEDNDAIDIDVQLDTGNNVESGLDDTDWLGSIEKVVPGQDVEVTVTATEAGAPLTESEITISLKGAGPLKTITLETDEAGQASTTVTIPDWIDGGFILIEVEMTVGNDLYSRWTNVFVARYRTKMSFSTPVVGETASVGVEATETDTGNPYAGATVTVFGSRNHLEYDVFDADTVSTGTDGTAELNLDIPADASYSATFTDFGEYLLPYYARVQQFDEPAVEVDGFEDAEPGETLSVGYSTEIVESNAALLRVDEFDLGYVDGAIIEEGTTHSFDIPSYLEPGGTIDWTLVLVTETGQVVEHTGTISVIDDTPADDVDAYVDDETGSVETEGLRAAIDDWRDDRIDTGLLREVIDAWREG